MISKIQKWGNSLGLRIPKALAEDANVEEGTNVDLRVEEGRLVVVPLEAPRFTLENLLREVAPENMHAAVDTGPPVGREAW